MKGREKIMKKIFAKIICKICKLMKVSIMVNFEIQMPAKFEIKKNHAGLVMYCNFYKGGKQA